MLKILLCLLLLCGSWAQAADVQLAWNPNSESDLAGYRIHYGTASGNYTSHVDVGNVTAYTVQGLTEGVRYYFAATAYDTAQNESGYSNEVNGLPSGEPLYIGATGLRASRYQVDGAGVTTISDNFNRSDSDDPGEQWTEISGDWDIVSNQLASVTGSGESWIQNDTTFGADQYVLVSISQNLANNYPGILLRFTNNSSPFYQVTGSIDNSDLYLTYKASVGTSGVDLASESLSRSDGDKLGITITGTGVDITVRVWLNPTGTVPDSATSWGGDTTPTFTWTGISASYRIDSGSHVGLYNYNDAAQYSLFDDFYAGDIPTAGASAVPKIMMQLNHFDGGGFLQ